VIGRAYANRAFDVDANNGLRRGALSNGIAGRRGERQHECGE
jgi:hypothetical protein